MTFVEFGLTRKIISNAGINFTSEMIKQFCRQLNIQQSRMSSYHHQSNGLVGACNKYFKYTIENALMLFKILI